MVAYRMGRYHQAQTIADERLRYAVLKNDLRGSRRSGTPKALLPTCRVNWKQRRRHISRRVTSAGDWRAARGNHWAV